MLNSAYMLDDIFSKISYDIAIDLGTSSILVYVRGKGLIVNEPSVVTFQKKGGRVLAFGEETKRMLGKTPATLRAIRPLRQGVISDFEATAQLLRHYIGLVNALPSRFPKYPKPRVVVGVPSGLTPVERRAVSMAIYKAGARKVHLVDEPLASALGAGLPIRKPSANMVVDMGGGTTEIAVISLAGIVSKRSVPIAGDRLDKAVVLFARERYNLLLGEHTAEALKRKYGSASTESDGISRLPDSFVMYGRNLKTGLPDSVTVATAALREVLRPELMTILASVKDVLESVPAEMMPDILKEGITLAGGTSLLRGLPHMFSAELHAPVKRAKDPVTCVVKGCAQLLEDPKLLEMVGLD